MNYSSLSQELYYISLGDEQAFRRVVLHFGDRLAHFAFAIIRNVPDSEEIVSDVFVKIWQLREHLPDASQFTFYLYRAVKHTSLNYLKKRTRKREVEVNFYVEAVKTYNRTPEDMVISKENMENINMAINALPTRCRQVFMLVKEEGLSYQQVAELLDISPATVNVQMTIAVRKLWQTLDLTLQSSHS